MSKFIQTNTIKDKLCCPKCDKILYVLRHSSKKVICPSCGWDNSFHYCDEEGN